MFHLSTRLLNSNLARSKRWISFTQPLFEDFISALSFDTIYPGGKVRPSDFKGKIVMVVNTASKCGYTSQLGGLQELHEKYKDKGLEIVAVPSNDFGKQEPRTDDEILDFYNSQYNTSFIITSKQKVNGDDAHEFFQMIVQEYCRSIAPTWNFDKFLLSHLGDLRAVFPHDVEPCAPEVVSEIEELIGEMSVTKIEEKESTAE